LPPEINQHDGKSEKEESKDYEQQTDDIVAWD